jgi:hypothetical protein
MSSIRILFSAMFLLLTIAVTDYDGQKVSPLLCKQGVGGSIPLAQRERLLSPNPYSHSDSNSSMR